MQAADQEQISAVHIAGNNRYGHYGTLLAGTLMLLLPAFINGYVLVNSDDATYLSSGFLPETPFDRPITYGLLLRLFSLNGWTLWGPVIMQAIIVSWLLVLTIRTTCPSVSRKVCLFILSALSLCSALSWTTSQLMPDIYTPIALLCLFLIIAGKHRPFTTFLLYLVFTVSIATHMSHILLFFLVISGMLCFCGFFLAGKETGRARRKLLVLAALTLLTILSMGSALSKSRHVFFLASMLQKGILKKYLDEHCGTHQYKLCSYKDNLPVNADEFLWNSKSPLYETGGWESNKEEYNQIIGGSLKDPEYLKLHITASLEATVAQAARFDIGDGNTPLPEGSDVYNNIKKYVPGDVRSLISARQQKDSLLPLLAVPDKLFRLVVILAIATTGILMVSKRALATPQLRLFVFLSLMGVLINIWCCATFSQVHDRYASKMIWLVPLCALLVICAVIKKNRNAIS